MSGFLINTYRQIATAISFSNNFLIIENTASNLYNQRLTQAHLLLHLWSYLPVYSSQQKNLQANHTYEITDSLDRFPWGNFHRKTR